MKQIKKLFGIFAMAGIFIAEAFSTGCSDDSEEYYASGDFEYTLAEELSTRAGEGDEDIVVSFEEKDLTLTVYLQTSTSDHTFDDHGVEHHLDPAVEIMDSIMHDAFYFLDPNYGGGFNTNTTNAIITFNFGESHYRSGRIVCRPDDAFTENGFRVIGVTYINADSYRVVAIGPDGFTYVGQS